MNIIQAEIKGVTVKKARFINKKSVAALLVIISIISGICYKLDIKINK